VAIPACDRVGSSCCFACVAIFPPELRTHGVSHVNRSLSDVEPVETARHESRGISPAARGLGILSLQITASGPTVSFPSKRKIEINT
jgi:hypothetical protein